MDTTEESLDVPLSATLQVVASAAPAGLELAVYEAAAQSYLWIVVCSFHDLPSHSSLDLLARDSWRGVEVQHQTWLQTLQLFQVKLLHLAHWILTFVLRSSNAMRLMHYSALH
jgi:hypothetical protein